MRAPHTLGLFVLGPLLLATGPAWAQPAQPAPTRTHQAVVDQGIAHFRTDIIERYRAAHPGATDLDNRSLELLGLMAESLAAPPTQDALLRTRLIAEDCIKGGATDPIVLYVHAAVLSDLGETRLAEAALRKAASQLPGSPYPVRYQGDTHLRLALLLDLTGRRDEARREYTDATDLIVEGARQDGPSTDPRLLLERLAPCVSHLLPPEQSASMVLKVSELPNVDLWLVRTLRGLHEIRSAWRARGEGPPTDEARQKFKDHMGRAYESLIGAHKAALDRPEPLAALITVAMGGGAPAGEDMALWFQRATEAEIDYMPAYQAMLLGLSPRWHGSHAAMLKFGMDCAATERYDTRVPFVVVEALRQVGGDAWRRDESVRVLGAYPLAKSVLAEYIRRAPTPEQAAVYRSHLVAVASMGGDYALARAQLDVPGWILDSGVTAQWGLDARDLGADAYAFSGSSAQTALKALEAANTGDHARARDFYQLAIDSLGSTEQRVADALRPRLELSRIAADFSQGVPVPLPFLRTLPGWAVQSGTWEPVDERTIKGTASADGLSLSLRASVGTRFEVSGMIDVSRLRARPDAGAGLAYGLSDTLRDPRWRSVVFIPSKDCAAFQYGRDSAPALPMPGADTHEFTIKVWDDEAVLLLDGKQAYVGAAPDGPAKQMGDLLSLRAHGTEAGDTVVFSNLRISLLAQAPTELARPARNPFKLNMPAPKPTAPPVKGVKPKPKAKPKATKR